MRRDRRGRGQLSHSERGDQRKTELRCGFAVARARACIDTARQEAEYVRIFAQQYGSRRVEHDARWIDAASDRAHGATIRNAYIAAIMTEQIARYVQMARHSARMLNQGPRIASLELTHIYTDSHIL